MTPAGFCTILARNYLPRALALSESLRRHAAPDPLWVLVTDAPDEADLPDIEGVRWLPPGSLNLPERHRLELAMSYDLVEFATALKPLLLARLLQDHDQVFYLDPDTFVVSPMTELSPALEASAGLLLTPHYLHPTPPGSRFTEGHLLHVGSYNLGFCGVDGRAREFLDWWWGHLRTECLHDPLSGLFVDQKWVDLGSVLYDARILRHRGYNVSVANLHERPIARDDEGYYVDGTDDRLRLFHFHAFDPRRPRQLTTRADVTGLPSQSAALEALSEEYASLVLEQDKRIGRQPAYAYGADTTGRRITRRMRHAYRVAAQADPGGLPSPFVPAEAAAYAAWRRGAKGLVGRLMLSDVAKGIRCALPEEYDSLKRRVPTLTESVRGRLIERSGLWN